MNMTPMIRGALIVIGVSLSVCTGGMSALASGLANGESDYYAFDGGDLVRTRGYYGSAPVMSNLPTQPYSPTPGGFDNRTSSLRSDREPWISLKELNIPDAVAAGTAVAVVSEAFKLLSGKTKVVTMVITGAGLGLYTGARVIGFVKSDKDQEPTQPRRFTPAPSGLTMPYVPPRLSISDPQVRQSVDTLVSRTLGTAGMTDLSNLRTKRAGTVTTFPATPDLSNHPKTDDEIFRSIDTILRNYQYPVPVRRGVIFSRISPLAVDGSLVLPEFPKVPELSELSALPEVQKSNPAAGAIYDLHTGKLIEQLPEAKVRELMRGMAGGISK